MHYVGTATRRAGHGWFNSTCSPRHAKLSCSDISAQLYLAVLACDRCSDGYTCELARKASPKAPMSSDLPLALARLYLLLELDRCLIVL